MAALQGLGLNASRVSLTISLVLAVSGSALLSQDHSLSKQLQVSKDGQHFLVTWDPSVPEIAHAGAGSLRIWEGNKPPVVLSLTPAQLRAGTLAYGAAPLNDTTRFRLEVAGETSEREPSFRPVAWSIDASIEFPAVLRAITQRVEAAPKVFVLPAHPAQAPLGPTPLLPEPPTIAAEPFKPSRVVLLINAGLRYPLATKFNPEPGAQRLRPDSNPANGSMVSVTSEPSGAEVQINYVRAGVTPLTLRIAPVGMDFTLTVAKAGFLRWTVQSIATDQPYSFHAQLTRSSP